MTTKLKLRKVKAKDLKHGDVVVASGMAWIYLIHYKETDPKNICPLIAKDSGNVLYSSLYHDTFSSTPERLVTVVCNLSELFNKAFKNGKL